jgi:hypothetical protein
MHGRSRRTSSSRSRSAIHNEHGYRSERRTRHLAAGVVAVALAAACSDVPPTEPGAGFEPTAAFARGNAQGGGHGLDAEFRRIAAETPGFAGMHYDSNGRLKVHVTREEMETPGARQRILASVGRSLGGTGRAVPSAGNVVFEEADHDYFRLSAAYDRLGSIFGVEGVVYTDIDEATNRLRVGVLAGTSPAGIESALAELDIPAEMVRLETTPAIGQLSGETLRDRVQPVGGGLQIVWEYPGIGFFLCTLGFNVQPGGPGGSQPHFITNSHCTGDQGVVTGTEYFQPLPPQFVQTPPADASQANVLGVEVLDPPFFACFGGAFLCRFSDAALVKYHTNNPIVLGTIYRTEFTGTTGAGSLDIADRGRKFFSIRGEASFPMGGETLDKVGRTTGWTRGQVFATCVNVLVGGTNTVRLCQDLVAGVAAGGDSGSPVFQPVGNSYGALLYGILWGGGTGIFAFSALENIRLELGDFRTH